MSSSPLVDFWTAEQSIYDGSPAGSLNGLRPRSEQALARARSALELARANKDQAARDAAAAQQQIAALRTKMATDDPADVESDAYALRTRIGGLRTAAGRVTFWSDTLLKLDADLARATAEHDRCVARATAAATALAAAKKRQATLERWLDPADPTKLLPAIAAMQATATAAVDPASAKRVAAEQQIAKYFPEDSDLRVSVTQRWKLHDAVFNPETGKIRVAADKAVVALDAQLAKTERMRITYERAWTRLATYARTVEEELARAINLYGIAASLPDPPQTLKDSVVSGVFYDAAKLALPNEKPRNDAVSAVVDAAAALADAALTAGAKDPVPLDSDVLNAYNTFLAKESDAAAAQQTFLASGDKAAIDRWEAALPDEAFRAYAAMQEATGTLERLKALDPATLLNSLSTAEQNLANALETQAKVDRVTDFLRDAVAQGDTWLLRAGEVRLDHLFSAARGDG